MSDDIKETVADLRRAHVYLDQGKPFLSGKDCAEIADLIEQQAAQIAELQASAITAEPIYQTRWGRPETVWGDVSKATYDDYQSFGYVARRIVYTAHHPTSSAIEATAALIANGLVGQASEEDVREVERLINELLRGE
jgi:hypothetical protein